MELIPAEYNVLMRRVLVDEPNFGGEELDMVRSPLKFTGDQKMVDADGSIFNIGSPYIRVEIDSTEECW